MTEVELMLAQTSPEIRAAFNNVLNLVHNSCRTNGWSPDFEEHLLEFFCQYDQFRSLQVERLKADLIEAQSWSVKPMKFHRDAFTLVWPPL